MKGSKTKEFLLYNYSIENKTGVPYRIGLFFFSVFENVGVEYELLPRLLKIKRSNGKDYAHPKSTMYHKLIRDDTQWNKKSNGCEGKCEIQWWCETLGIPPELYEDFTKYEYPTNGMV